MPFDLISLTASPSLVNRVYMSMRNVTETYRTLSVAVLPGHGQVEAEPVRVDDLDVAGLGAAQGIDPAVEGAVGSYLHHNPSVLAMHRHCIPTPTSPLVCTSVMGIILMT